MDIESQSRDAAEESLLMPRRSSSQDDGEVELTSACPLQKHFLARALAPLQKTQGEECRGAKTLYHLNPLHICAVVFLALLASWGALDIINRLVQPSQSTTKDLSDCWCGTSDNEAQEMGCIYDHIAVDWLPPHCIDSDLVEEFDRSGSEPDGSWPYFEPDPSRAAFKRINSSDIDLFAEQSRTYYATLDWHVAHCLFTWRKQFRAAFGADGRRAVEPWNQREEHVEHCTAYILSAVRQRRDANEVDTRIRGSERHMREMEGASSE